MRYAMVLKVGILLGGISAGAWGQNLENDPYSASIRAQEAVVATSLHGSDGTAWLELAVLYQDRARYQKAKHAYRKAISLLKSQNRVVLADGFDHLGTMYTEIGHFAKAASMEQKALAMREIAGDPVAIGISYMHLSVLSLGIHDLPTAELQAETAVGILLPDKNDPSARSVATPEQKMTALIDLSLIRCARHACTSALPDLTQALRLAQANYGVNSLPVGFLDYLVGYAHWKSGDNRVAAELMKKGTDELAAQLGWGHPTYIAALQQYDAFLLQNRNTADAAEIEVKIAELEKSQGVTRPQHEHAPINLNLLR